MVNPEQEIARAFKLFEEVYGVKPLGHVLAKSLTAVTARISCGTVEKGGRTWPIKTEFVCGRVSVNFSPGTGYDD